MNFYNVTRHLLKDLGKKAFKVTKEGPPRALTDNARNPLTGVISRKAIVQHQ